MSDLTTIVSLLTEIRDRLPVGAAASADHTAISADSQSASSAEPQPALEWVEHPDGWWDVTPNRDRVSAAWYTLSGYGYVHYWQNGGWDMVNLVVDAISIEEEVEAVYRHADANGIAVPDHPVYPRKPKSSAMSRLQAMACALDLCPVYLGYVDGQVVRPAVHFKGVEVKDNGLRMSPAGRGDTFEEAASDYLRQLYGKVIVYRTYRGRNGEKLISENEKLINEEDWRNV